MNSENQSFNITEGESYQEVRMNEHKFPWWILLLLLPLILLIPMERNLLMKFVDAEYGMPVSATDNQILFQNIKTFGGHVDSLYTGVTDEEGRADTITVREPLWHWLFGGSGDSVYVTIDNGCAGLVNAPICYNDFVKDEYKEIKLTTKKKESPMIVVDKDNGEPLPGATVEVTIFHADGSKESITLTADEAGQIVIPMNPICDNVSLKASKQYYKDETLESKINDINENQKIELEPLKESIKVLVRDAKTRELIPGATVTLYLDGNRHGDDLTTNINGTILAHFDDLRINLQVKLEASKAGYKPNTLEGYTVEQFAALDDEQRTIYLEPIAKRIEFINTDGNRRLPGVKNVITVNGQSVPDEMSNANGTFSVMLVDSDIISIVSSKPGYGTNSVKVNNKKASELTTQDSRTIPLTINRLVFIDTDGTNRLPGVSNVVTINGRPGGTKTSNGSGEFTIDGLADTDVVSIVASKAGYNSNSTKVNNKKVSDMPTQPDRTIPLSKIPAPPPPPPPSDMEGQSGDLRINLKWNNHTDLDLHVIDPCGNKIYYSKKSASCGSGTGTLDVDSNAGTPYRSNPQENCYWLSPQPGVYKVMVDYYSERDVISKPPVDFTITIVYKGVTKKYTGTVNRVKQKVEVTRFVVD